MQITKDDRIKMRYIPAGYAEYKRVGDAVVYAAPDMLGAISFRGTSSKPVWFFRFTNKDHCERRINGFFQMCDEINQRAQARKDARKEFNTSLKPGDILVSSWGYEQTNINWYQVISVKGKRDLIIREIAGTLEETGFMCGDTMPIKDQWAHDSLLMKKRAGSLGGVGREYVKINESQTAFLWDGRTEHCSWYG